MNRNTQVQAVFANLFSTYPLVTIDKSASCQEAISLMAHHRIHHLIVTENNCPTAIVTDRDIFYRVYSKAPHATASLAHLIIDSVMRKNLPVLEAETTLSDAIEQMQCHGVSALLSRNSEGSWGIITETDLLRLLNKVIQKLNWREFLINETETTLSSPVLQKLIELVNQMGI